MKMYVLDYNNVIQRRDLTFRIRPEKITHGAVMRHLQFTVDGSDLVEGLNARRETPVYAENLKMKNQIKTGVIQIKSLKEADLCECRIS